MYQLNKIIIPIVLKGQLYSSKSKKKDSYEPVFGWLQPWKAYEKGMGEKIFTDSGPRQAGWMAGWLHILTPYQQHLILYFLPI